MKNKLMIIAISVILIFLAILLISGYSLPSNYSTDLSESYDFIEINNFNIHYYHKINDERNETIVFLHSFGGNLQMWDSLMNNIKGYNILTYDMIGFGKSDKPIINYSLDTQAFYLKLLLEKLGIEECHLIGSSMGASTAVYFCAKYPQSVKKLVLMAPSGYPGSMNHKFPGNLFYKPGILNKLGQYFTANILFRIMFPHSLGYQAFSVTASYDSSYISALTKIVKPVLLFWSKGDNRSLFEYSDKYRALLKNCRFVIKPEIAGHNIHSFDVKKLTDEIVNFLSNN
jgi:pimeloyl-ACP methyl ester carboxylesterase